MPLKIIYNKILEAKTENQDLKPRKRSLCRFRIKIRVNSIHKPGFAMFLLQVNFSNADVYTYSYIYRYQLM